MDDNDLIRISDSMKEKLGEEDFAKISDSIGELITGNTRNLETIKEKEEQITKLQDNNSKLIMANGNLLKQVPMGKEEPQHVDVDEPQKITINDILNDNGELI